MLPRISVLLLAATFLVTSGNAQEQNLANPEVGGGAAVGAALSSALSMGLPLGVPPAEPNDRMLYAPPEDTSVCIAWSAIAVPSSESKNRTESLLAESDVRFLMDHVASNYQRFIESTAMSDRDDVKFATSLLDQLAKLLLTHETSVYARVVDNQPAGGLVCDLGDDVEKLRPMLQGAVKFGGEQIKLTERDGLTIYSIQQAPVPPISVALGNRYLLVGVGKDEIEALIDRMKSDKVADWLSRVREQLPVDRVANLTYVNVEAIGNDLPGDFDIPQELAVLANEAAKWMACVTGFDDDAVVVKTHFEVGESTKQRLQKIGGTLAITDIQDIASDANVMAVLKVDPVAVSDSIIGAIDVLEPGFAEEFKAEFSEQFGVDFDNDVIAALGDTIQVYESPSEGGRLLTGWTGVLSIKDTAKVQSLIDRLKQMAEQSRGSVTIKQREYGGAVVSYLVFERRPPGFTPSWCLHENRLIVSAFPQNIFGLLAREESQPSQDIVKSIGEQNAAFFAQLNEVSVTEHVYPLAYLFTVFLRAETPRDFRDIVDIDPGALPSLPSITKHMASASVSVSLNDGVDIIRHQTLPPTGAPVVGAFALFADVMDGAGFVEEPPRAFDSGDAFGDAVEAPEAVKPEVMKPDLSGNDAAESSSGLSAEASAAFREAVALAEKGQHTQAARILGRIVANFPDDLDTLVALGTSQYETRQYKESEATFAKSVKLAPDDFRSHLGLGKAIWVQNRNEESIGKFERALEINPESGESWLFLGWAYNSLKQYDKAIENFSRAREIDPSDWRAIYLRGVAYFQVQQNDKALDELTLAVKGRPSHVLSRHYRAFTYKRLDRLDEAIADMDVLIKRDPLKEEYLSGRADMLEDSGQNERAIRDYNALIGINATNAEAWKERAGCWLNMEKYERALKDYTRGIELAPDQWAFVNRATCWEETGESDKAIADYTEALKLDPKYAYALRWRAERYFEAKRYAESKADYEAAIAAGRTDKSTLGSFSWLLAACPDESVRDGKLALQHATKAAELSEWKEAWIIDNVAAAHAELGDFEKAIEFTKRGLEVATEAERGDLSQHLELYQQNKPVRL